MVVEPEPVVVAERVPEVALDRAPVRDRRVRPAGGVVGVLHHDHLPGELAAWGPARQQARAGEVLGPLRVERAAVDAELRVLGRVRRRPGSGGSRCTRGTRGCRRPLRRPVARPRSARRSRHRRGACRRPHRCRTASDPRRRRCRTASPRPPSPPATSRRARRRRACRRHRHPRTSGACARGDRRSRRDRRRSPRASTVVFSSMRLVASSPSAPM